MYYTPDSVLSAIDPVSGGGAFLDRIVSNPPYQGETVTAADRDELARGSHLTPAQIAAMPDATVARLVQLMRDRADVARDYEGER